MPTSSSWINLVERWFAELATKLLRRGQHGSVPPAQRRYPPLDRYLNENPRPYVWTKTTDEILDSIKRYLERLPQTD